RPLMGIDDDAVVLTGHRAGFLGKIRAHTRAERGVDAVEAHAAAASVECEPAVLDGVTAARTLEAADAGFVQLSLALWVEFVLGLRRDQRHIGGVAAQEYRFRGPVYAGADYRDAAVGYL